MDVTPWTSHGKPYPGRGGGQRHGELLVDVARQSWQPQPCSNQKSHLASSVFVGSA